MSYGPTGESGPLTKCPPLLYIPNQASTLLAPRGYKGANRGHDDRGLKMEDYACLPLCSFAHTCEGRSPQAGTPEIANATQARPCGIGRQNRMPWGRLIPTVGMLTTTGPLGTAQAGLRLYALYVVGIWRVWIWTRQASAGSRGVTPVLSHSSSPSPAMAEIWRHLVSTAPYPLPYAGGRTSPGSSCKPWAFVALLRYASPPFLMCRGKKMPLTKFLFPFLYFTAFAHSSLSSPPLPWLPRLSSVHIGIHHGYLLYSLPPSPPPPLHCIMV
uniref:Uncharacterized protein n=1 Tax=Ananas comosus var. bracteatus TaxID=296719 RepID=A0A6V7P5A2_ANACO|nr:unnamed protein product [Ananas comosus var. bracteatus]